MPIGPGLGGGEDANHWGAKQSASICHRGLAAWLSWAAAPARCTKGLWEPPCASARNHNACCSECVCVRACLSLIQWAHIEVETFTMCVCCMPTQGTHHWHSRATVCWPYGGLQLSCIINDTASPPPLFFVSCKNQEIEILLFFEFYCDSDLNKWDPMK